MTFAEKKLACNQFFNELASALCDSYEIIASCNADFSRYLVPIGTVSQITYYGKPKKSFRVSDHWNWYANTQKCENPNYIQCLSVDMPWAKKRPSEGKASKPITGIQVSLVGDDGKYHVIFGERYDRKKREWTWVESSLSSVLDILEGE